MRRISTGVLLLVFCFFVGILSSCKHDPQGLEKLSIICFNTQVAPILVAQCSVCHSNNGAKGGYVIDSVYNNALNLVNPGKPWASKLYNIVSSPNNPNMMPPNKALSKEQLTILEVWIAQGANNIICSPNSSISPIQPIASTDGAVLYSTYCAGCHGPLATSAKMGASAAQIQNGISTVAIMKNLSLLSEAQKQAIAGVLAGAPTSSVDGAVLYSAYCVSCHGLLATSSKIGATITQLQTGINTVSNMQKLSILTLAQQQAIIKVLAGIPITSTDGAILYSSYCANCHGPLASSAKIGATATQIQSGISVVPDMKSLSILTTAQKQAIADVLVGTPNANPDGKALYAASCARCHSSLATSSAGQASTSKINEAIKSIGVMNYLSTLSAAQISAISVALQSSSGSGD